MIARSARAMSAGRFGGPTAMRDELSHALIEALYELDVLPADEDAAMVALYAVMDDLHNALSRAEAMDLARSA